MLSKCESIAHRSRCCWCCSWRCCCSFVRKSCCPGVEGVSSTGPCSMKGDGPRGKAPCKSAASGWALYPVASRSTGAPSPGALQGGPAGEAFLSCRSTTGGWRAGKIMNAAFEYQSLCAYCKPYALVSAAGPAAVLLKWTAASPT